MSNVLVIFFADDIVYIGINNSNKDHQNFNVTIVLCSSAVGYVPRYNPETGDYGCLTIITQLIAHSFTIMVCNRICYGTPCIVITGIQQCNQSQF